MPSLSFIFQYITLHCFLCCASTQDSPFWSYVASFLVSSYRFLHLIGVWLCVLFALCTCSLFFMIYCCLLICLLIYHSIQFLINVKPQTCARFMFLLLSLLLSPTSPSHHISTSFSRCIKKKIPTSSKTHIKQGDIPAAMCRPSFHRPSKLQPRTPVPFQEQATAF